MRQHHRPISKKILFGSCAALCLPLLAQEPLPTTDWDAEILGPSLFESAAIETRSLDVAEPVSEPVVILSGGEQPRASRWRVAPHLDLTASWDDNIFIQPTNATADFVFTLEPGIALGFWDVEERLEHFLDREHRASAINRGPGNFLLLDYTAILLGFEKTSSENSLDHDARIEAQWQLARLTLGAAFHADSKSQKSSDVGGRVRRKALASELTARYQLTEKTSLEVSLFNVIQDFEGLLRSNEWRTENYLDYQLTPLAHVAVGLALGRVEVESGADQVFERILARALYSLTEKVEIEAHGGVEFRQSDGEAGDHVNPVFHVTARYEPAAGTRIGLEAYRRVETSAFQPDQAYTLTGIALKITRALAGGVHLSLAGGFELADYTESPQLPGRTDHYYFVRPGLLYNFAQWGNAEVSYEYRQNDSSRPDSSFENNVVSVRASLIY